MAGETPRTDIGRDRLGGFTPLKWLRDWFEQNALALGVVALLLVLWEIYTQFFNYRGDSYFPSIEYVITQSWENRAMIIEGVQTTAVEVAFGFVLAVLTGVVLGIIFAESYVIRQASLPGLVFAYSVPHAVLAPLFIIWFGSGLIGVGLFVAWFGFFMVLINTITGFTQVSEEFRHLGEVTGASRWQMIKKIKFWAALPHITGGIKVAVQQSIIGAVIAEFIASSSGLGYQILVSGKLLREGMMFGVLIVLMVFAVTFYKTVVVLIDYVTPGPRDL